jgi:putative transposase
MKRAVKVSIGFATINKRRQVAALLEAYRGAVNFYIRSLWVTRGKLDKTTLVRLQSTRLSQRYKSQALKQAIETVVATKRSAKELGVPASRPVFKGSAVLDSKFVKIEEGRGAFDLVVRLSTLHKGHRISIPTKKTVMFHKWENRPLAKLIQGCALSEDSLVLWFELPDMEPKTEGDMLGVDIGVCKLLSDSDGNHYGRDFRKVRDKVRRRKPGSNGRRRAHQEREQFINRTVKLLPFDRLAVIGVEDLNNLKRGKKRGRGKSFRKAIAPWTYRHVLNRIEQLAQENRVLLVRVDPANTSRTCPMCDAVHKENRKGEVFRCLTCNHTADADTVGALNILARTRETLRSVESLVP